MKNRFRIPVLLLIMTILITAAAPAAAAPQINDTGTAFQAMTERQKAKKAYREFLSKKTIVFEDGVKVTASKTRFVLASLNGDDIPELILDTYKQKPSDDIRYMIYTFKNGKVKELEDLEQGVLLKGYYKKENTIKYTVPEESASNWYYFGLSSAFWAFADMKAGLYTWRGTTVIKSRFNKNMKSRVGSTSYTSFKFYTNTAANRKNHI